MKHNAFASWRADRPTRRAWAFGRVLLSLLLFWLAALEGACSDGVNGSGPVVAWGDNRYGQCAAPTNLTPQSGIVALAAGANHSLALLSDGTVVAWGATVDEQCEVPAGLGDALAIAAGDSHSLALRRDGTVVAWGYDVYGQTDVPDGLSNVVAIAAGAFHNLALKADGTVTAWGYNPYGQASVPADLSNVVAIAAGTDHSLALRGDGLVVLWGGACYCGDELQVPPGLDQVVAIAAGRDHNLALRADGTVVAWGPRWSDAALAPADLAQVAAIEAGFYHNLVLKSDGAVVAWGGQRMGLTNEAPALSNVVAITAGLYHNLALVGTGPPLISSPPIGRCSYPGRSVNLYCQAAGELSLNYQWQFNGANLEGATHSLLTLPQVQLADAGGYRVLVSNAFGTATSDVAVLRVIEGGLPELLVQPADQQVWIGKPARFWVIADGPGPLRYQWRCNGVDLAGATNSLLVLEHPGIGQAGTYSVEVSNTLGGVTSSSALLEVWQAISWAERVSEALPGLTNAVAIAAGQSHVLGLKADGTVAVAGSNSSGQTNVPAGLSNGIAIAAGDSHSLALKSDGTVVGWGAEVGNGGNPEHNPALVPTNLSNVVVIAAGGNLSMAVKADGSVVVWGDDSYGQTQVPATARNVIAVATFGDHCLALRGDHTVVAWGNNEYGKASVPPGLTDVVAVAATTVHSLALKADGTLVGWGCQDAWCDVNVIPPQATNVVAISGGGSPHYLALRREGTVVGWGYEEFGAQNVPVGLSNVVAIAGGGFYSTALLGNTAPFLLEPPRGRRAVLGRDVTLRAQATGALPLSYQWRFNGTNLPEATNAWLTINSFDTRHVGHYSVVVSNAQGVTTSTEAHLRPNPMVAWGWAPQPPSELDDAVAIAGGWIHALALRADGTVVAWGNNDEGQTEVPVGLSNVVAIAAGERHNLALRLDGTVVAWGADPANNSYYDHGQSVVPPDLQEVIAIAAAGYVSVALQADGTVRAWGDNSHGQITVPLEAANIVAIATSGSHCLALREDGRVVAWGWNDYGQTSVPPGLTNAIAIAATSVHSLALRADGTVIGWGCQDNWCDVKDIPTGLSNVAAIAGGGAPHYVALRKEGYVVAWGYEEFGAETAPPGLSNVVAVAAGGLFSMALLDEEAPFLAPLPPVRNAFSGNSAVFRAAVTGTLPLSYQWQFNGAALPGATNAWLVVPQAQAAQVGGYSVTVSNALGVATSGTVMLTVSNSPPLILEHPQNQTDEPGATASFQARVIGSQPCFYQWQFNGTNLADVGQSRLALSNLNASQAGEYRVVVSNSFGVVTSAAATLTVRDFNAALNTTGLVWTTGGDAPWSVQRAVSHDGQQAAQAGHLSDYQTSWLYAEVTGPGVATFWWKVASATHLRLRFSLDDNELACITGNVDWQQCGCFVPSGTHNLVWTYNLDDLTSPDTEGAWLDQVTFIPDSAAPPFITLPPASCAASLGGNATLSVEAIGAPPLSYQWRFNGNDLAGADQPSLPLAEVRPDQAGRYSVVVSNAYGMITSSEANLTVLRLAHWGYRGDHLTDFPLDLTNVVAVAGGTSHTLALRADGIVVAWGDNEWGQTNVPPALSNVVAITAGSYFSLALTAEGRVVGWGDNSLGQMEVPADLSNVVAMAASDGHCLALKSDGTVAAWGVNASGQAAVPPGLTGVVAIAAGVVHSLALTGHGQVVAWGTFGWGLTNVPPHLTNVVAIAAAYLHCLALQADGRVVAWGDNLHGRTNVPPDLSNVVAIAAGCNQNLALRSDGTVVAWGDNTFGQGDIPVLLTNAGAIATGHSHCLALVGQRSSLQISPGLRTLNTFSVSLPSRRGQTCRLEYKNTLAEPWWTILPPRPGDGSLRMLADPSATGAQRFYRVRTAE